MGPLGLASGTTSGFRGRGGGSLPSEPACLLRELEEHGRNGSWTVHNCNRCALAEQKRPALASRGSLQPRSGGQAAGQHLLILHQAVHLLLRRLRGACSWQPCCWGFLCVLWSGHRGQRLWGALRRREFGTAPA